MLHKTVFFLVGLCFCGYFFGESKKLDFKIVTAVRHGLMTSLEYIDRNLNRVNVDCLLGVAFVRAFMGTAYKNGYHIMDKSSLKMFNKSNQIISKARVLFQNDLRNGGNWKFKNLVDTNIWTKAVNFQRHFQHWPTPGTKAKTNLFRLENSDICLQQIVNATQQSDGYAPCVVTKNCWNDFFRDPNGDGYYLTHKLLLLQVAKARHCLINQKIYDMQVEIICSSIMYGINADLYEKTDDSFDLFLEQVLLCGYEGFADFIQTNWIFLILKSQRRSGCFPADLTDPLKSRIKKDMNYFEDGCNDHSTGLGAAVLGLYYNYIVNEEENSLE